MPTRKMIGTEDRITRPTLNTNSGADLELVQQVDERQHRQAGGAGEDRCAARAAAARWRAASGARGRWPAWPARRSGSRAGRCRRPPRSRARRRPSARCRPGRRRRTRSSGTAATGTRAGSSRTPARRSGRGRACRAGAPSGNPASRNASGSSHRSPSQMPAVSGSGSGQRRSSCETNQISPITTISAPTWFSGRRVQATQPLATNDQPTSRKSCACSGSPSSIATTIASTPDAEASAISVRRGSAIAVGARAAAWEWRERGRVATVLACGAAR